MDPIVNLSEDVDDYDGRPADLYMLFAWLNERPGRWNIFQSRATTDHEKQLVSLMTRWIMSMTNKATIVDRTNNDTVSINFLDSNNNNFRVANCFLDPVGRSGPLLYIDNGGPLFNFVLDSLEANTAALASMTSTNNVGVVCEVLKSKILTKSMAITALREWHRGKQQNGLGNAALDDLKGVPYYTDNVNMACLLVDAVLLSHTFAPRDVVPPMVNILVAINERD